VKSVELSRIEDWAKRKERPIIALFAAWLFTAGMLSTIPVQIKRSAVNRNDE
jgi:hypothetical protein